MNVWENKRFLQLKRESEYMKNNQVFVRSQEEIIIDFLIEKIVLLESRLMQLNPNL